MSWPFLTHPHFVKCRDPTIPGYANHQNVTLFIEDLAMHKVRCDTIN